MGCEADWDRPANAPKARESKVNCEGARRVDPPLADESFFRLRRLEDELRHETKREAGLLQAKVKSEKHRDGE